MHKYLFNYRVSFYITSKLNLLIRKKKNIWKRNIHILVFVLSCLYTLENISEKGEKRDFIKRIYNDHNAKCIIRVSILKIFFDECTNRKINNCEPLLPVSKFFQVKFPFSIFAFELIICSSAATFVNATRIRRLKRSIKTSERGDKKNGGRQRTGREGATKRD